MTDSQQFASSPFQDAWGDLRDRLASATTNLSSLRDEAQARALAEPTSSAYRADCQAEITRLEAKRSGIEQMLVVWERLNLTTTAATGHAAAWRTFTDEAFVQWQQTPEGPVRSGIALSLDYQRGYGPAIDAPPLVTWERRQAAVAARLGTAQH